jgi:hypothetical protein
VRLGREIELAGLAAGADHGVGRGIGSEGNGLVREVGHAGQQVAELLIEVVYLRVEGGDGIADAPHFGLALGSVEALLTEVADLGALGVAAGLELLGLRNGGPAAGVEIAELVEIEGKAAGGEPGGDRIEVVAKECEVVHGCV